MRTVRMLLAGLTIIAIGSTGLSPASEAESEIRIPPTQPFEYWQDPCGYPAIIPSIYRTVALPRLLSAEVLLVQTSHLERRIDDPSFYRLKATGTNNTYPGSSFVLGAESPFIGHATLAPTGRTGFLIAPDVVATAAHYGFNPANYFVIFDARALPDPAQPTSCIPFDPEHIPEEKVFSARPVNALIADTMVTYPGTSVDYAAFYLDRTATGRQYVRIRMDGDISPDDHFAIVGHPFFLTTKLLYDISYVGDVVNNNDSSFIYPTFFGFYLIPGMSGGAVYNLDRNYVEIAGARQPASAVYIANMMRLQESHTWMMFATLRHSLIMDLRQRQPMP